MENLYFLFLISQEVIAKHKWKKTNEECTNFIDVYLQEIEKKNSSHSCFNGNHFI